MNVAIVGVTGLVGQKMLKILEERRFPVSLLIPVASKKSIGKLVSYKNANHPIIDAEEALRLKPDIALFSAGSELSQQIAPLFAENGVRVIDNSSAWRMDESKKLIVPEVNGNQLDENDFIIANPNCSTIQLMMAVFPLQRDFGIKRMVISTYQSVSGSGIAGLDQLEKESFGESVEGCYPHAIHENVLPHAGDFDEDGYTSEENKLVNETRKILGDQNIQVTATVVRVPVRVGHSISVNIELKNNFDMEEIIRSLENMPGVKVVDDPTQNSYPMPKDCEGIDEVLVGRIRRDKSQPNTLNMWVVADNLRKGAATNAIQIAEYVKDKILTPQY